MRFIVVSSPKRPTKNFPVAVLVPDSWDDFGFKTMFQVTYWRDKSESTDLGTVKILKRGQKQGHTKIPDRFSELAEDYCSLGQNLEYYETIRKLPRREHEALLRGIRDVVFSRLIRAGFEDERGFKDSLLRSTAATSALEIAPSFFSVQVPPLSERGPALHFKTSVGGTSFLISFDFDGDKRRATLP